MKSAIIHTFHMVFHSFTPKKRPWHLVFHNYAGFGRAFVIDYQQTKVLLGHRLVEISLFYDNIVVSCVMILSILVIFGPFGGFSTGEHPQNPQYILQMYYKTMYSVYAFHERPFTKPTSPRSLLGRVPGDGPGSLRASPRNSKAAGWKSGTAREGELCGIAQGCVPKIPEAHFRHLREFGNTP